MKLARDTLYNFVGLASPLLVAFYTIPRLIHGLGDARWGLLTLIWAVVSYFGLFALWLLTPRFGLPGAATVWLLRMTADTCLMYLMRYRAMGWKRMRIGSGRVGIGLLAVAGFVGVAIPSMLMRGAWVAVLTAIVIWACLRALKLPSGLRLSRT